MRRVRKGFSGVETPPFEDVAHDAIPSPSPHVIPSPSQEPSSLPQQQQSSPQAPPQDAEFPTQLQQVLNVCSALSKRQTTTGKENSNPFMAGVNKPRSDEDRLKLMELMVFLLQKGGAEFPTHLFQQVLDTCSALTRRVENLEHDIAAQKLEIIKLKARVKRLKRANKVKSSKLRRLKKVGTSQRIESSDDMEDVFNQWRMIDDLDKDEGIELIVDQVKDADIAKTERRHATEQAENRQRYIIWIWIILLNAASATIFAAKPSILVAAPTVVAAYKRKRKEVIIRDPEEELSSKTPVETPKLKDKGKGILIEIPKPMKKKDQIELDAEYARKLHEEIRMSYDEIRPIFQARFDANMRFLLKSREEIEEEDREKLLHLEESEIVWDCHGVHGGGSYNGLRGCEFVVFGSGRRWGRVAGCLARTEDLLELMLSKRSKKNTKCVNAVSEELTAAKNKLMLLIYCC
uniref:Uncharacterized protein n=1 Tax=Tanacetum cinerariifolium TaxID=118510 RepID=A0A6L2LI70_TANCI|nr:hypothetical protein [Tanacetum cinerariifolium]